MRIKKKSPATPGSTPSQGAGATPTQEEGFRGFQPLGPPAAPGGGSKTPSPMGKPVMANPYANPTPGTSKASPTPGTSKAKDKTARDSGMPSAIDRRKLAAARKKKLVNYFLMENEWNLFIPFSYRTNAVCRGVSLSPQHQRDRRSRRRQRFPAGLMGSLPVTARRCHWPLSSRTARTSTPIS